MADTLDLALKSHKGTNWVCRHWWLEQRGLRSLGERDGVYMWADAAGAEIEEKTAFLQEFVSWFETGAGVAPCAD